MLLEQLQNPFFIIILIILFSVFAYVVKHEEYIPGFVYFLFASLGAVLQMTSLGQIGLLRALILVFLFGVLLSKNMRTGKNIPIANLLLIAAYAVSVYISGTLNDIPFKDYRSEVGLLIMAMVVSLSPSTKQTLRILTIAIMLWGLINAVVIIAAKLGIHISRMPVFNDGGRAIGLSRHSTFMGAYFSISLVALQILYIESKSKFVRLSLFFIGILIMLGLLATIARGAFIGWLVAFLFVQYRLQGMKVGSIVGILVAALIGLVAASLLGLDQQLVDRFTGIEKDNSAQARIPLLLSSFNTFSMNPIFGTGVGWEDVSMQLESHNMIIQVLVEAGMVGFILFVTLLWRGGWSLLMRSNIKKEVKIDRQIQSHSHSQSETTIDAQEKKYSSVMLRTTPQKIVSTGSASETVTYHTGLVAMLGAILLNSLTHSFDFFMPFWMLVAVGLMKAKQ